ncbi:MAG: hypothetical protein IJX38_05405 [Clostridia bacterium]|nr:hypothetical protein [Clostridia bacterium]
MKTKNKSALQLLYCTFTCGLFLGTLIYVALSASHVGLTPTSRLMLLQSTLGIISALLPLLLSRVLGWHIPSLMLALYELFLILSIFLGEIILLYERVSFFDDIMHLGSAALLATLGYSLIAPSKGLTPKQTSMYIVAFALSVGVFWELFEFTADGILGLNMQRFLSAEGMPLVGRAALSDTMQDLIVDLTGAASVGALYSIGQRFGFYPLSALKIEFGKNSNHNI